MFVLNYLLEEFLSSEVANHFELRCESKQLMLSFTKSAPIKHYKFHPVNGPRAAGFLPWVPDSLDSLYSLDSRESGTQGTGFQTFTSLRAVSKQISDLYRVFEIEEDQARETICQGKLMKSSAMFSIVSSKMKDVLTSFSFANLCH